MKQQEVSLCCQTYYNYFFVHLLTTTVNIFHFPPTFLSIYNAPNSASVFVKDDMKNKEINGEEKVAKVSCKWVVRLIWRDEGRRVKGKGEAWRGGGEATICAG